MVCPAPYCYVGEEDAGCRDGHITIADCPQTEVEEAQNEPVPESAAVPWSGRRLGRADAEAITGTRRPRLVAIVGLPSAGKTTALAAFWVLLRRGHRPGDTKFAGSYSMLGWHEIARHMSWPPEGGRRFPPHTTTSGKREPALLHTALRDSTGIRDVLFTDVPGEWFREWAIDRTAVPGATWIAEHADVFVLLSDSDRLSGPTRGEAQADYRTLANRVAGAASGRPVLPIRAKADKVLHEDMRGNLERLETRLFGDVAAPMSLFSVSGGATPLLEPLDTIARIATQPVGVDSMRDATATGDPLLDLRRATGRV